MTIKLLVWALIIVAVFIEISLGKALDTSDSQADAAGSLSLDPSSSKFNTHADESPPGPTASQDVPSTNEVLPSIGTDTQDESSVATTRILSPTGMIPTNHINRNRFNVVPTQTIDIVNLLSQRLLRIYSQSYNDPPSPQKLNLVLAPLRNLLQDFVSLLGLEQIPCNTRFGMQEIQETKINSQVFNRLLRILEVHLRQSGSKTPWLDLLHVLSPNKKCGREPSRAEKQLDLLVTQILGNDRNNFRNGNLLEDNLVVPGVQPLPTASGPMMIPNQQGLPVLSSAMPTIPTIPGFHQELNDPEFSAKLSDSLGKNRPNQQSPEITKFIQNERERLSKIPEPLRPYTDIPRTRQPLQPVVQPTPLITQNTPHQGPTSSGIQPGINLFRPKNIPTVLPNLPLTQFDFETGAGRPNVPNYSPEFLASIFNPPQGYEMSEVKFPDENSQVIPGYFGRRPENPDGVGSSNPLDINVDLFGIPKRDQIKFEAVPLQGIQSLPPSSENLYPFLIRPNFSQLPNTAQAGQDLGTIQFGKIRPESKSISEINRPEVDLNFRPLPFEPLRPFEKREQGFPVGFFPGSTQDQVIFQQPKSELQLNPQGEIGTLDINPVDEMPYGVSSTNTMNPLNNLQLDLIKPGTLVGGLETQEPTDGRKNPEPTIDSPITGQLDQRSPQEQTFPSSVTPQFGSLNVKPQATNYAEAELNMGNPQFELKFEDFKPILGQISDIPKGQFAIQEQNSPSLAASPDIGMDFGSQFSEAEAGSSVKSPESNLGFLERTEPFGTPLGIQLSHFENKGVRPEGFLNIPQIKGVVSPNFPQGLVSKPFDQNFQGLLQPQTFMNSPELSSQIRQNLGSMGFNTQSPRIRPGRPQGGLILDSGTESLNTQLPENVPQGPSELTLGFGKLQFVNKTPQFPRVPEVPTINLKTPHVNPQSSPTPQSQLQIGGGPVSFQGFDSQGTQGGTFQPQAMSSQLEIRPFEKPLEPLEINYSSAIPQPPILLGLQGRLETSSLPSGFERWTPQRAQGGLNFPRFIGTSEVPALSDLGAPQGQPEQEISSGIIPFWLNSQEPQRTSEFPTFQGSEWFFPPQVDYQSKFDDVKPQGAQGRHEFPTSEGLSEVYKFQFPQLGIQSVTRPQEEFQVGSMPFGVSPKGAMSTTIPNLAQSQGLSESQANLGLDPFKPQDRTPLGSVQYGREGIQPQELESGSSQFVSRFPTIPTIQGYQSQGVDFTFGVPDLSPLVSGFGDKRVNSPTGPEEQSATAEASQIPQLQGFAKAGANVGPLSYEQVIGNLPQLQGPLIGFGSATSGLSQPNQGSFFGSNLGPGFGQGSLSNVFGIGRTSQRHSGVLGLGGITAGSLNGDSNAAALLGVQPELQSPKTLGDDGARANKSGVRRKHRGWYELWFNSGDAKPQSWKLIWNNKETRDFRSLGLPFNQR